MTSPNKPSSAQFICCYESELPILAGKRQPESIPGGVNRPHTENRHHWGARESQAPGGSKGRAACQEAQGIEEKAGGAETRSSGVSALVSVSCGCGNSP